MATNGYGKTNKRKHTISHPYAKDKKRTKTNNGNADGSDQNGLFGSFLTTIRTFSQQWLTKAPTSESDSEANESDHEIDERQIPQNNNSYWSSSSNHLETSQRYNDNNNNNESRQSFNSLDDAIQQLAAKGITQQEFEKYMDMLRRGLKNPPSSSNISPIPYQTTFPIIRPIPHHDPTNTSTDVVRSFIVKGQRPAPTQPLSSSMYDIDARPSSSSVLKRGRVVSPQQENVPQQIPPTDTSNIASTQISEQEVYLEKQPPFKRRLLKTNAAQTTSPVSVSEAAKRILVALDQVSSPVNAGIPSGLNTARKKENVPPVGNGSAGRKPVISKTIVGTPASMKKKVSAYEQMDEEAPPTEALAVPQDKKTKTRIQVSEYAMDSEPTKQPQKNGKTFHAEDEEEKLTTKPKRKTNEPEPKPKVIEVEEKEKPRKQPDFTNNISAFPVAASSPATFSFGADDSKKKKSIQIEEPDITQKKAPLSSTSSTPANIAASIADKIAPQFSLPISPPAVEKSTFSAASKINFDFQNEEEPKQTEQVEIRKKKRPALTSTPKMFSTGSTNPFSLLAEDNEPTAIEPDKSAFTPLSFSTPESKPKEKPAEKPAEKPKEQEEKKETPSEPKTFAFEFGKKEDKKEDKKEIEKPAISSPPPTFSFLSETKKDEQKEKTDAIPAFTSIAFPSGTTPAVDKEKEKKTDTTPATFGFSAVSAFKPTPLLEEPEKPKLAEKEKAFEPTPSITFTGSFGTTPTPTEVKKKEEPVKDKEDKLEATPGFSFGTIATPAVSTAPSLSLTPAPVEDKKKEEPTKPKVDSAPTVVFTTPAPVATAQAALVPAEKKGTSSPLHANLTIAKDTFVFGTSATPAFSFGTSSTPAAATTPATPAATSTPTATFPFGQPTPSASSTPAASDQSMEHEKPGTGFGFGTPSALAPAASASKPTFGFGLPTPAAPADFVFGSSSSTSPTAAATSSFGTTPSFGTSSSSTGPTFSFGTAPSASAPFGSTASTSPSFGASATPAPFGSSTSTAAPFGSTTTSSAPFGSTTSSTGASFGSSAPFGSSATTPTAPFGTTSTPAPFGSSTSTGTPFGSTTSTTPSFGSTPAFGSSTAPTFGSTASTFGSTASPSPFGSSTSSFGGGGFSFGAPAAPAASSTPATTSDFVFGGSAPTASSFGTSTFGAPTSATPAFGSTPAFGATTNPPSAFSPAAPFSGFGGASTPTGGFAGFGTDSGGSFGSTGGGFNIGSGGDKSGRKIVQAKRNKGKKV